MLDGLLEAIEQDQPPAMIAEAIIDTEARTLVNSSSRLAQALDALERDRADQTSHRYGASPTLLSTMDSLVDAALVYDDREGREHATREALVRGE
ncbi:MAG: hypothetical protein AAFW46_00715 [Pseudomonadota bacterium]